MAENQWEHLEQSGESEPEKIVMLEKALKANGRISSLIIALMTTMLQRTGDDSYRHNYYCLVTRTGTREVEIAECESRLVLLE